MKVKPIIIINGDPNSIFVEIFFKSLNLKNLILYNFNFFFKTNKNL